MTFVRISKLVGLIDRQKYKKEKNEVYSELELENSSKEYHEDLCWCLTECVTHRQMADLITVRFLFFVFPSSI